MCVPAFPHEGISHCYPSSRTRSPSPSPLVQPDAYKRVSVYGYLPSRTYRRKTSRQRCVLLYVTAHKPQWKSTELHFMQLGLSARISLRLTYYRHRICLWCVMFVRTHLCSPHIFYRQRESVRQENCFLRANFSTQAYIQYDDGYTTGISVCAGALSPQFFYSSRTAT